jgi:hypothetical protein
MPLMQSNERSKSFRREVFMRSLLLVIAVVSSVLLLGYGSTQTNGSGTIVSETRDVSGFTGIALETAGDIIITQGDSESLTIETDDNILPLLTSEVEDGVLVLSTEENASINPSDDIRYTITVTSLEGLEISGAGDVTGQDLTLDALSVNVSGAGDIILSGTANNVSVTVSGSGDFQACNLQSGAVSLEISGQGDAVVNAADTLSVTVSGMGDVSYVGDPEVSQDVSGMGDVTQIESCE